MTISNRVSLGDGRGLLVVAARRRKGLSEMCACGRRRGRVTVALCLFRDGLGRRRRRKNRAAAALWFGFADLMNYWCMPRCRRIGSCCMLQFRQCRYPMALAGQGTWLLRRTQGKRDPYESHSPSARWRAIRRPNGEGDRSRPFGPLTADRDIRSEPAVRTGANVKSIPRNSTLGQLPRLHNPALTNSWSNSITGSGSVQVSGK